MPFKDPHPLYQTWMNMKSRCNVYTYPNGDRKCRICMKASQWRYRERRGLRQSWTKPILVEVV